MVESALETLVDVYLFVDRIFFLLSLSSFISSLLNNNKHSHVLVEHQQWLLFGNSLCCVIMDLDCHAVTLRDTW